MGTWRRHTLEFKKAAVERMRVCGNIRELGVQQKLLYTWKHWLEGRQEETRATDAEGGAKREESKLEWENARLKAALAEKTLEVDFFRGALRRIGEARRNDTESGGTASTPRFGSGRESGKAD